MPPPNAEMEEDKDHTMQRYEVVSKVGEGAYGVVLKCKDREYGDFVAIKKFKESDGTLRVEIVVSNRTSLLHLF